MELALAQRAQIESIRSAPPMIVTDWLDAALAVANDDGRIATERAFAAAGPRTPAQADKHWFSIVDTCYAIHRPMRSCDGANGVAVCRESSLLL